MSKQILNNYSIKVFDYLENLQIPFINYLLTFICLIHIRIFFESFTHAAVYNLFNMPSLFLFQEICHFALFYIFLLTLFTLILFYATHERIVTILKVVLPAFVVTIFVPIVDLIISQGQGKHIYYLIPNHLHNLFYYFVTFFGDYSGFSYGMRVEILIATICAFLYLRYKKQSILKSLSFTFLIYCAIFIDGASPYITNIFYSIIHRQLLITPLVMLRYFLIVTLPLIIWIAFLVNKKVFTAIWKDVRFLRLFHYELMLSCGIVLGFKAFTVTLIPQIILLAIAILFFWLFAIITNNIADQNIDRISNQMRPLITNSISIDLYKTIGYICLFLSLIYALAVNFFAFGIIAGATVTSSIYSLPPLRLKKIPVFSKMLIAVISLGFIFLGFYLTTKNIALFPKNLALIIFLGFSCALNLIDLKDYHGDKADGIKTLPVILGMKNAKILIGLAFLLANLLFYFYFKNGLFLALLSLFGLIEFYLINKKNYQEKLVIEIYLLNICTLIFLLFINPNI